MAGMGDGVGQSLEGRPTSAAQTSLSRIMTTLDTNLLGTVGHPGVARRVLSGRFQSGGCDSCDVWDQRGTSARHHENDLP